MWKKKDEADILSNFAPALLMTIVVAVIVIVFSSWMSNIERKQEVNQIARKYILKMETTGGLTTEMESDLRAELSQYCDNITLSFGADKETTREGDAIYGEDIDLYIQADMRIYDIRLNENPDGKFMEMEGQSATNNVVNAPEKTAHIMIHKSSTSKH